MRFLVIIILAICNWWSILSSQETYSGHVVSEKGAWCWFADPRALHFDNGLIQNTYIGYIDVHGNIKATQHSFTSGETKEVLVRSYFQPDDHNNPTFLVLPDNRIMIFYSRHTDERAFYYRISSKPGDITSLGDEKRLATNHNTTYPSPYILSDDSDHIYLAWRGINWHPTIAKLSLPDENDDVDFVWGPHQIVQSTAARPYAKYSSNGKDKIFMGYTTGHPDNENPNYVYFHYIDINTMQLVDVMGNIISSIVDGPHHVSATNYYTSSNPNAVVDNSHFRNWIWEVTQDSEGNPVLAIVRISNDKRSHNYYHAQWDGFGWVKTFLANGGGAFHQTPGLEMCYSGGMALDGDNPNIIYCSVPVDGVYGQVYEIIKYTVNSDGSVTSEQITTNSKKNNIRPFYTPFSENTSLNLVWMHGDYYDWIVSSARPQGFPTAIHAHFDFGVGDVDVERDLVVFENFENDIAGTATVENGNLVVTKSSFGIISTNDNLSAFSVTVTPYISHESYEGTILTIGDLSYSLDEGSIKPYLSYRSNTTYSSTNVLGTSDAWRNANRGTGGHWYEITKFDFFTLTLTYNGSELRVYINGLLDQSLDIIGLELNDVSIGGFDGVVESCYIHSRALNQLEVKEIADKLNEILSY
ncbi:BNR-4 repeat-containing protein [Natronoflexus pectinivorans]|uniref:Putative BNR repeat neuraminidase n=1 Tax=Natronoflexus pectinivorans TaxID=682526 RepID=A0A4R2GE55_9BACT|nr:BNR-4 repeat-containing protein [Natronoflexus pectinivorans]TCO06022.1 putative BNR repeat neuraminidase [Natronoflexus pectinivorans]